LNLVVNATEPVERESRTEQAYRELRRRILDNELPASTSMLEQEVAELLGMSRTPVREALILLAKEGLVEVRPRQGMRVLPVSPDDMADIYQVLTALEAEAAGDIARHGLPKRRLKALRDAVRAMDEALEQDDLLAWAAADNEFHRLLMGSSRNARLRALVHQFWDQGHRVRMLTLRLRPKPVTSNRDHLALVEAIERRDADAARSIHREHRIQAGQMLVGLLRQRRLAEL
jgi:DNA-binding GntR family transcriptional regulator